MTNVNSIPEYVVTYLDACSRYVSNREFAEYTLEQAKADLETIHNELYESRNEFDAEEQEARWNEEFGSLTVEEFVDYVRSYGVSYLDQE